MSDILILSMKSTINWRIFFILLSLSLFSIFAIFPYILTLQGNLLKESNLPITIIFLAQLFQGAIILSIAIFVGLKLAKKVGFHLPLLEALVGHNDYKKIIKNILPISVFLGITVAVLIFVIDYLFTLQGSAISTNQNLAPVWQKLLAAFYGGITEEILMRLFLMTLFVWIGMKVMKQTKPSKYVIIISIILAAGIFGLGHLPVTATLTKLTPLIITRAVLLNGIGGIVFGYLYWKKGLESAMIAHFTADIILLSVLPLLIS